MKIHINFVCVYELEQSTTNLSFTFYLKNKILKLTNTTPVLKIFFPSRFGLKF